MNKKRKAIIIFIFLFSVLLAFYVLLVNVELCTFDQDFYRSEFRKHGIVEKMDTDEEQLMKIVNSLHLYMKGKADTPQLKAIIEGEEVEVFGERELLHMEDVQYLYLQGFRIKRIVLALILISFFMIYYLSDKGEKLKYLIKALTISSAIGIISLITLTLLAFINFDTAFIYFHHIFFDNDLWILNPRTDNLIKMLPQAFFFNVTRRIILGTLLNYIMIGLISYFIIKKINRREEKLNKRQL